MRTARLLTTRCQQTYPPPPNIYPPPPGRDLGPEIPNPPRKDMGPGIAIPPCGQNDWQIPVKTLPSSQLRWWAVIKKGYSNYV